MSASNRPLVLVPACNRMIGLHAYHIAGRKYVDAVRLAGCRPLVIPQAGADEIDELLDLAHGVLLTGSPSNVHPSHYGEDVHNPALLLDPDRDDWTLPLVRRTFERGVPLFGICRGFQEANVALGGTLHQAVQEIDGHDDHRAQSDTDAEVQYGIAHPVEVVPGGLLADIVGARAIEVNSVHGQGVKRLADGLRVEARAPDGLIEAFTLPASPGFNLCVQWHPEWKAAENPVSMKLLRAFGAACAAYRDRPRAPQPPR